MKKLLFGLVLVGTLSAFRHAHALTSAPWITSTTGTTNAQHMVVSGNYAYLADGQAGLKIFSIATKSQPTLVATYDTPGTAESVDVGSNNAYIADGTNGLVVVNISDPTHPVLVKTVALSGQAHGVKWGNALIYVADGTAGYMQISNVDPTNPYLLSSFDTDGDARDVWGNLLTILIADGSNGIVTLSNAYQNILAGDAPVYVGRTATAGPATSLTVSQVDPQSSRYLFVSEGAAGIEVFGGVDTAIAKIFSYDTTGTAGQTWLNQGANVNDPGHLYIADGAAGILVLTVYDNPAVHFVFATFPLGSTSLGISAPSDNSYAYVADGSDGLSTVSLATPDPIAPTITLLGANTVNITVGALYQDAGFIASDNVDGDRHAWASIAAPSSFTGIKSASNISGNFTAAGTFVITFTVSDAAGNSVSVQRTIIVSPAVSSVVVTPTTQPTTTPSTTKGQPKGTSVLLVNGKTSTTVTPKKNYYGSYSVTRINFGIKLYTIVIPLNSSSGPQGVFIYGPGNVLVLAGPIDANILSGGMTFSQFFSSDKRTAFIVVRPRGSAAKIMLYKLTASGAKTLPSLTATTKSSSLTYGYLKLYKTGFGLVTAVANNNASFRVWKYDSVKSAFVRDTSFKISKLKFLHGAIVLK